MPLVVNYILSKISVHRFSLDTRGKNSMARHSLFPNSITIHYNSNAHDHLMVLPVGAVTGSAPGWLLPTRDASTVDWRTAVDDFCTLIADLFDNASSFAYAELFTYEATNSPAEFLAAHTIDLPGTGGSTPKEFVQAVFPFKGLGGLSLRLTLLEGIIASDQHVPASSTGSAAADAVIDFILGDDDWIITRGGAFPSVSLGFTSKVNDKLRKRYLLDS
jgi:hypothetical protein